MNPQNLKILFGFSLWVPKQQRRDLDEVARVMAGKGQAMRPSSSSETAGAGFQVPCSARPMRVVTKEESSAAILKSVPPGTNSRQHNSQARAVYRRTKIELKRHPNLVIRQDGFVGTCR